MVDYGGAKRRECFDASAARAWLRIELFPKALLRLVSFPVSSTGKLPGPLLRAVQPMREPGNVCVVRKRDSMQASDSVVLMPD
jgi:hypothetical protein